MGLTGLETWLEAIKRSSNGFSLILFFYGGVLSVFHEVHETSANGLANVNF